MSTNEEADFGAGAQPLLHKEEVYQIVGSALEVLNEIGPGLREKTYERALLVEFRLRGIEIDQQSQFPVIYKGEKVDEFVPDLVAFGKVVVDAKTIEVITDRERGQMLSYLRVTGLRVGVILNFKRRKLEWERIAL